MKKTARKLIIMLALFSFIFLNLLNIPAYAECLSNSQKDMITTLAVNNNMSSSNLIDIFEIMCNQNVTYSVNVTGNFTQNISELYNITSGLLNSTNSLINSTNDLNQSVTALANNTYNKSFIDTSEQQQEARFNFNLTTGFNTLYNQTTDSIKDDITYGILTQVSNITRAFRDEMNNRFTNNENVSATKDYVDNAIRNVSNSQAYTAQDIAIQQGNTQFLILGGVAFAILVTFIIINRKLKLVTRQKMGLVLPSSESKTLEEFTINPKMKSRLKLLDGLKKIILDTDTVKKLKITNPAKLKLMNLIAQGSEVIDEKSAGIVIPNKLYYIQKELNLEESS